MHDYRALDQATRPELPGFAELERVANDQPSLRDRFLVPPFSVLDARQGYWQERKRAWINLGIRSELGRGDALLIGDGANEPGLNHGSDSARAGTGLLGFSDQTEAYRNGNGSYQKGRKADAIPGGAGLNSAIDGIQAIGKYQRQDNGHTPGPARAFGQDLMRGERVSGNGSAKSFTTADWVRRMQASGELGPGLAASSNGTSIFDPVLCELVYRWFAPASAAILDPFTGGSVRGIVAHALGHTYTGIDLSASQIAANQEQAADICPRFPAPSHVPVKISAASMRLAFHGCTPEYIRDVCGGACCRSTSYPNGTLITIHPSEELRIVARGARVVDGLIDTADTHRCPFQDGAGLCGLHGTPDKPFGCIASPFTLNSTGTLIVRNRYKLLRCYNDGPRIPAYHAFRASLDRIFGAAETARIVAHLDNGGGDLIAQCPAASAAMLRDNDAIKHGAQPGAGTGTVAPTDGPRWIVGDSRDVRTLAPGRYDLLFSCPPYADLERYSDDPRDLSTLPFPEFLTAYRHIIAESAALLADDRFAVFVVGDIRDPLGIYCNFVGETIRAFSDAGLRLYNEAVLITMVGSLPIRVGKQFTGNRKLGKTHQNVLVFVKGDPKRAAKACAPAIAALAPDGYPIPAGDDGLAS